MNNDLRLKRVSFWQARHGPAAKVYNGRWCAARLPLQSPNVFTLFGTTLARISIAENVRHGTCSSGLAQERFVISTHSSRLITDGIVVGSSSNNVTYIRLCGYDDDRRSHNGPCA